MHAAADAVNATAAVVCHAATTRLDTPLQATANAFEFLGAASKAMYAPDRTVAMDAGFAEGTRPCYLAEVVHWMLVRFMPLA